MEVGLNANSEHALWMDHDAAVSIHCVRANVKAERRRERLAFITVADHRISLGASICACFTRAGRTGKSLKRR